MCGKDLRKDKCVSFACQVVQKIKAEWVGYIDEERLASVYRGIAMQGVLPPISLRKENRRDPMAVAELEDLH